MCLAQDSGRPFEEDIADLVHKMSVTGEEIHV
jgi:hypothetical protein